MSAAVAHEIKNPLTVIGGFARRLHRSMGQVDPNWETVGIIIEEVSRLERLLEQMRSFSQTASRGVDTCDVNLAIQKILSLVQGELEVGSINFEASLSHGLPNVLISEDEMKQVLLNLIQNAIEATPSGGYLKVGSFYDGQDVMVQVKDTGTGIPSDILESIFQPFVTTKENGSGLGLALSHQIIKACGGSIKVEQSEPESGTTFRIYLPVG